MAEGAPKEPEGSASQATWLVVGNGQRDPCSDLYATEYEL